MNEQRKREQVDLALRLAEKLFSNRYDKGGMPYTGHLHRVANRVDEEMTRIMIEGGSGTEPDPRYYIVGLLHDIMEDTNVKKSNLIEWGFDTDIVDAVDCITKRKGESYFDYIVRVKKNDLAHAVKIFDLEDNMDVRRLKKFGDEEMKRERKYWYSWMYLNGSISEDELWRNIG